MAWTKRSGRHRVWARLSPVFSDVKPSTITLIDISAWRAQIANHVSEREAHRCIKIWRALWQVMAALKYCDADNDPSFGVRDTESAPRSLEWQRWGLTRIGKRAWRDGFKGLAAILAVMWDGDDGPCRRAGAQAGATHPPWQPAGLRHHLRQNESPRLRAEHPARSAGHGCLSG